MTESHKTVLNKNSSRITVLKRSGSVLLGAKTFFQSQVQVNVLTINICSNWLHRLIIIPYLAFFRFVLEDLDKNKTVVCNEKHCHFFSSNICRPLEIHLSLSIAFPISLHGCPEQTDQPAHLRSLARLRRARCV